MKTEFILRKQSNWANTYGVGEVVIPGVVLFRAGNYDLTLEDAEHKLKQARKGKQ